MDYEAQYNNRARVPEHGRIIERWMREAPRYREEAAWEPGLRYGDSERQTVDIFRPPEAAADAAMFVFIHGGYWQGLEGRTFSHLARGLNERGFAVAIPTYDLCPQVSVGDIIEQMRRCCLWLHDRTQQPLVVSGHSAGGHLAAAMLATDWARQRTGPAPHPVRAAFAISGLFELEPLCATSLNDALKMTPQTARAASPALWPAPAGTRFAAWVGELESSEFHRQSTDICKTWGDGGVETSHVAVPGANHFTVIDDLGDPDSAMVEALAALGR